LFAFVCLLVPSPASLQAYFSPLAGQIRMAFQQKENDILAETGTRVTNAPAGTLPVMEMFRRVSAWR
jgi:hypothetical protein